MSRHHGPVRVLEAHIVEVRLLRTKGTLKLACVGGPRAPSRSRRGRTPDGTYLLLEAHAAAALLDGVFVEGLALLRERHKFVRLRVSRRVDAARSDDEFEQQLLKSMCFARRRARTVLPKIPSRRGIFIRGVNMPIFSCPGYRRETLAVVSKINQWIGQTYDGAVMAKLAP